MTAIPPPDFAARADSWLTPRQRQVRDLLIGGMTYKQAGRALGISPRTIDDHALSVLRAYGVPNFVLVLRLVEGLPLLAPLAPVRSLAPPLRGEGWGSARRSLLAEPGEGHLSTGTVPAESAA